MQVVHDLYFEKARTLAGKGVASDHTSISQMFTLEHSFMGCFAKSDFYGHISLGMLPLRKKNNKKVTR